MQSRPRGPAPKISPARKAWVHEAGWFALPRRAVGAPEVRHHTLCLFIRRACDFFDLFVFSAYPISCISSPPQSRHPERSASEIYRKRRALSAESKDPGDAFWQMLLGVSGRKPHRKMKKSQTPSLSRFPTSPLSPVPLMWFSLKRTTCR